jgi:hypothetical protein
MRECEKGRTGEKRGRSDEAGGHGPNDRNGARCHSKPDWSAAQVRIFLDAADDPDLRYAPVRLVKRLGHGTSDL